MEARALLRHSLRLEKRDGFPWNRVKGRNALPHKGIHYALKRGSILPRKHTREEYLPRSMEQSFSYWPTTVSLRKEQHSRANLFREAQTRSYPDANLHDSSANLSQSRIESEAELNHHGDVRTSHTTDQSNSKYFEVSAIADFRKL